METWEEGGQPHKGLEVRKNIKLKKLVVQLYKDPGP